MPRIKKLNVVSPQGFSGELWRESQYVFNYETSDPSREIALAMPLRKESYAANILPGVLRQNLPEGYLLDWITQRFGKVTKMDDMTILAITDRDVIGRIRTLQDGDDGQTRMPGMHLKDLLTWKGTENLFADLVEQYASASGISGIQPKVVAPIKSDHPKDVVDKSAIKDRSVIIKSSGDDYPFLAENEYICMSIAKAAGISTPNFWLSENKNLFIVERFDIKDCNYLGFEDMTSLMNKQNDHKYDGSYEMVARAVALYTSPRFREESLRELFSSVVLSILLRNGDAHLKNFGVLYTHPGNDDVRLSPLYDVVNTTAYIPRDTLALKLNGSKVWPTTEELVHFGKINCRVDQPEEIIDRIATAAMAYRPPEQSDIWKKMQPEIERGCLGLNSKRGAIPRPW